MRFSFPSQNLKNKLTKTKNASQEKDIIENLLKRFFFYQEKKRSKLIKNKKRERVGKSEIGNQKSESETNEQSEQILLLNFQHF